MCLINIEITLRITARSKAYFANGIWKVGNEDKSDKKREMFGEMNISHKNLSKLDMAMVFSQVM